MCDTSFICCISMMVSLSRPPQSRIHLSIVVAVVLVVLPLRGVSFVPPTATVSGSGACASIASSCRKHVQRASGSQAASARTPTRSRRWGSQISSTPENVSPPEEAVADSDEGGSSTDTENESRKDVWARAELPLSNDQQVEQATGAVWKVTFENHHEILISYSVFRYFRD